MHRKYSDEKLSMTPASACKYIIVYISLVYIKSFIIPPSFINIGQISAKSRLTQALSMRIVVSIIGFHIRLLSFNFETCA
jgi:hypothetical protein